MLSKTLFITVIAMLAAHPLSASSSLSDAELIGFAGIQPGYVVAEFLPDDEFTAALCNAVGEAGRLYAVSVTQPSGGVSNATCNNIITIELKLQRHAAPDTWSASDDPGVVYEYWSFTQPAENFATPEPLDAIFTQHYHQLRDQTLGPANTQLVGAAWLQALKPGGVLIVADSAQRIQSQQIKQEMLAVGFIWAGERKALQQHDRFLLKFRKPIERSE